MKANIVPGNLRTRVGKLTPIQVQHLIEIGAFLCQVREEQGISLEQVTATTYVPLRMLRAIESGQVDILPEAVFVQGFIRRHAEALGLDGIAVAKQFPINPSAAETATDQPPQPDHDEVAEEATAPDDAFALTQTVLPTPEADLVARRMSRRSPSAGFPLWLGLGTVALVIIGIGVAVGFANRSSSDDEAIAPSPEPEITAAEPLVEEPTEPTPPPATPASPIAVTLNASEPAWVSITVDGTTDYEGTLPAGTERQWEAQRELVIFTGNAGGVTLSYNGGEATSMGDRGQTAEITYTPTGPSTN